MRDQDGNDYVMPDALIAALRVPDEARTTLDEWRSADDVAGYSTSSLAVFSLRLESQAGLGKFQIQNLMSQHNRAGALASSLQKKGDDASGAVIRNLRG